MILKPKANYNREYHILYIWKVINIYETEKNAEVLIIMAFYWNVLM